jgi:hypothetical protein
MEEQEGFEIFFKAYQRMEDRLDAILESLRQAEIDIATAPLVEVDITKQPLTKTIDQKICAIMRQLEAVKSARYEWSEALLLMSQRLTRKNNMSCS